MPRRLARGNRRGWAAGLACLMSAAYLIWQMWRPDAEVSPPAPPTPIVDTNPAPAPAQDHEEGFSLADASEYSDITERPMFTRSRRPPPASDAGGGATGGPGGAEEVAAANLTLAGVLVTRGRRVALVRIDNDPKLMHVGEGQQAGGWLIEQIKADRVVLRRGENSSEIALDYSRHPSGTSPPSDHEGGRHLDRQRDRGGGQFDERPGGAPRPPPEPDDDEPTE